MKNNLSSGQDALGFYTNFQGEARPTGCGHWLRRSDLNSWYHRYHKCVCWCDPFLGKVINFSRFLRLTFEPAQIHVKLVHVNHNMIRVFITLLRIFIKYKSGLYVL